ncbi:MAG: MFS transporter [Actinomycetia bacterium]|nr:MFS transporter [Actinomycetes bacterium]MCP5035876.1 MFS transporter [Actinomycetes bacterium]
MEEDKGPAVGRRRQGRQMGDFDLVAALRQPGFPSLYAAGFLFNTARWSLSFLAAFVANDLTSSPRAVQLTGAAMWAPMLAAGVVAGGLADRLDRRRILVTVVALLVPVVLIFATLDLTEALAAWMLYPLMVWVGLSWVADMTSRRTLVLDIVGVDLIDNAMALESLSTAVGLSIGVVAGGAVVDALGVGQAFIVVAAILAVAGLLIAWSGRWMAPAESKKAGPDPVVYTEAREGLGAAVGDGLRLVRTNRRLGAGLGVTVVANTFYFSHTPLVPVFAEDLGAGPFGAGLLASAGGLGMMAAALIVVRWEPPRGITYVVGAIVALAALTGLGVFTSYGPVFVSLVIAAIGFGLFAATQSAVILTSVDEEHRGKAMGLLSMAIGALPFGMYSLGEVAEVTSPRSGVIAFAIIGLVVMVAWVGRRREVLAAR